jgi:hypothetical protein
MPTTIELASRNDLINLHINGQILRYDPSTGEIFYTISYFDGDPMKQIHVYKTGRRGVVKVEVGGETHRIMDVIHRELYKDQVSSYGNYPEAGFNGYQARPNDGDFTNLRASNIVLIKNF